MTRIAIRALISIVAVTLTIPVAAAEELPKSGLLELQKIPGASELGWIEVMRESDTDDLGWRCKGIVVGHLYSLQRLREGKARVPADVAERGWQAMFNYEARHGGLPVVDGGVWEDALGIYLIARLTFFSENGKSELRMPKPSLTWRGWLRKTLEEINKKADRRSMSAARKRKALGNWIMCHISEAHAEQIRQVIYDNPEKASNQ